jgi:hypothetical protein
MRFDLNSPLSSKLLVLALIMLAGGLAACTMSVSMAWDADQVSYADLATQNAQMATQLASHESMISYLATLMPRARSDSRPPTFTPTPYLPVQGTVIIEEGRCCAGGVAGDTINVAVSFRASSQQAEVTEMRVRVGGMAFNEEQMADIPWEPFARQRRYPVYVAINWAGFYISVQYRDALGNMSPVYVDDISVEGMPPTPTVSSN